MKKIFLSLGFSGREKEDVMKDIEKAKSHISSLSQFSNEELEFIHNYDYTGNNRVECLGEAIKKMSTCDIVYFINDWLEHKGCSVEYGVCFMYNIPYKLISI